LRWGEVKKKGAGLGVGGESTPKTKRGQKKARADETDPIHKNDERENEKRSLIDEGLDEAVQRLGNKKVSVNDPM